MSLYGDYDDWRTPSQWSLTVIGALIGITSVVVSSIAIGVIVTVSAKRELERVLHPSAKETSSLLSS